MAASEVITASGIAVHCAHDRLVDVTQLVAHPRNPNKHSDKQIGLLAKIIQHQGWRNSIVVSKRSGFIVAGHGRLQAAHLLGVELVPVDDQDFETEADEYAHLLADNRLSELAETDNDELSKILADLEGQIDLDLTGFDQESLADLLSDDETPEPDSEPQTDRAVELQSKWGVQSGQIWQLGEHRLLCGDCRNAGDVSRLLAGEKINVAITSPPYASQREYDPASGFKPIHPDDYVEWWEPVQSNIATHLAVDGSFFCNIKSACDGLSRLLYVFDLVLAHARRWNWIFAEEFCWERIGIPQQVVRRFKNQFEPVYQFTKGDWKIRPEAVQHEAERVPQAKGAGAGDTNAARRQGVCSAVFGNEVCEGMAYPGNRLPPFAPSAPLGHAAVFPVGLPSFFIKAFSDPGDIVYEPFSGSGTTLIASERLGRRCRAIEISPGYVAVAIQRWADETGQEPSLK